MPLASIELGNYHDADLPFAGYGGARGVPGKSSLTSRLHPRRTDAPPVQHRAVAPSAASVAPPLDDPFALHLIGMPVQRKAAVEAPGEDVHAAAARGVEGGGATLPYLQQIAASFGATHDVSGIQAHVGGAAAEASAAMGAQAYATGNHVAFAGAPDLHTAAHEAAHVVQQRGGVQLKGGVGEVGDAYEQHADAVADLVVQGRSAASLLDRHGGESVTVGGPSSGTVQRKIVYGEMEFKRSFIIDDIAAKQKLEAITKEVTGVELKSENDDVYSIVNGLRLADEVYDLATPEGEAALKAALDKQFSKITQVAEEHEAGDSAELPSTEASAEKSKSGGFTPDDKAEYLKKTYAAEIEATNTGALIEKIIAGAGVGHEPFDKDFEFQKTTAQEYFRASTAALTIPDIAAIEQDSDLFYEKTTPTREGPKVSPRKASGVSIAEDCHMVAEHELIHLKIIANNNSQASHPSRTIRSLGSEDEIVERVDRMLELLNLTYQDLYDKKQYTNDNQSVHWLIDRVSYAFNKRYGDKDSTEEDWKELPTTIREIRRYFTRHHATAEEQVVAGLDRERFEEIKALVEWLDNTFAKCEDYEPVSEPSKK